MPRPDHSRAVLVDTAATLFRRQGYAATGLNQILEAADVRAGSLYHHFPKGKQELAATVVDTVGGGIEQLLRQVLAGPAPVQTVVGRWVDILSAQLAADHRDGCPVEPIATEAVHGSELVRLASARAFDSWCAAFADRLRADGWPGDEADDTALAVVSLVEGALVLSRTAGDRRALDAAKGAAQSLLSR